MYTQSNRFMPVLEQFKDRHVTLLQPGSSAQDLEITEAKLISQELPRSSVWWEKASTEDKGAKRWREVVGKRVGAGKER